MPVVRRPKIAIISSALPPRMDGIGDHSSGLAAAFAEWADVTLHSTRGFVPCKIDGVQIVQSFDTAPRKSIADLVTAIAQSPPDWLILQYNPFCFGNGGINPYLAPALGKIRRSSPAIKLAVMVHEMHMHTATVKFAIMSLIQRRQFAAVTALADVTLFSTGPWAEKYRQKFPNRATIHMPVGSNLPLVPVDRDAVRQELGFDADTFVLGSFGGDHPSRLFNYLASAARRLKEIGRDVRILSIGTAGATIKSAVPELPVIDLGSLPAQAVSRNLHAVDIYASPFFDGVSTRRGSFFAGIQHGLATVTTRSYHSDGEMLAYQGKAFLAPDSGDEAGFVREVEQLGSDVDRRLAMGACAKKCFDENYSLPVLADRWREFLVKVPVPSCRIS